MKTICVIAVIISVAYAASLNNRIVGGEIAANWQFPYQVSIRVNGVHNCGGSILSARYILTAAHCLEFDARVITIVTGSNLLNTGGDTYQAISWTKHEQYNSTTYINDIALIKVGSDIKFNNRVQPVVLNTDPVPTGADMVISGWGWEFYANPNGVAPNALKYLWVKSVDNAICSNSLTLAPILDSNICVYKAPGQAVCKGDSGGPLMYNGKQAGITSWIMYCATGVPDVFTRVSSYIGWIRTHMI